ncbi:MAG: putative Ribosome biogenesis protein BMS1, partial [Streblomastix strix]
PPNISGIDGSLTFYTNSIGTLYKTMRIYDPGVSSSESTLGLIKAKFKKHRWYHKQVLKSSDPLVISLGWRRFQSLPLYSIQDQNQRYRLLKYTPSNMHCIATFWAPFAPQGSGVIAFQHTQLNSPLFRIAGTGTVAEVGQAIQIKKKLKLIGHPFKIFKNTAFIRDMFNSEIEVAKFEGAAIQTVSGIRGSIKKALTTKQSRSLDDPKGRRQSKNALTGLGGQEGSFRATFEDKIQMSDIVFLRTWANVEPKRIYNPLCTVLDNQMDVYEEQDQDQNGNQDQNVQNKENKLVEEDEDDDEYEYE